MARIALIDSHHKDRNDIAKLSHQKTDGRDVSAIYHQ